MHEREVCASAQAAISFGSFSVFAKIVMKYCLLYQREREVCGLRSLGEVVRSCDIVTTLWDGDRIVASRWRKRVYCTTWRRNSLLHAEHATAIPEWWIARRSRDAPSLKTIIKASRGRVVAGFVTECIRLSVAALEEVSGKLRNVFILYCRIFFNFQLTP